MTTFEAFAFLDKFLYLTDSSLLTNCDWNKLETLSKHYDYEIKLYLCEVLSKFPCKKSENILFKLLGDDDKLVSASACDALCFSDSADIFEKLKECTVSEFFIVRGYAYLSIGEIIKRRDITDNDILFLKESLKKEKSIWVKASIGYAFCLNGFSDNLFLIEILLQNRRYNYRIYALNLLIDLFSENMISKNMITDILSLFIKHEKHQIILNKANTFLSSLS